MGTETVSATYILLKRITVPKIGQLSATSVHSISVNSMTSADDWKGMMELPKISHCDGGRRFRGLNVCEWWTVLGLIIH